MRTCYFALNFSQNPKLLEKTINLKKTNKVYYSQSWKTNKSKIEEKSLHSYYTTVCFILKLKRIL